MFLKVLRCNRFLARQGIALRGHRSETVLNTMKNSSLPSSFRDYFEVTKLEHGFAAGNVRLFCPTRWTVRGDLIDSILENYPALMQLLDECLESRHYYTGDEGGFAMATPVYGQLGAIYPESETIAAYLECAELYFRANGIKDKTLVPVFFTVIGRAKEPIFDPVIGPKP
uniref:Uncharacterized protein n=1 Tax=Amphimedon queenslandica TaxID=400682 RepID=A0A1X7TI17_AMPQE